jgi:hypothetical protein
MGYYEKFAYLINRQLEDGRIIDEPLLKKAFANRFSQLRRRLKNEKNPDSRVYKDDEYLFDKYPFSEEDVLKSINAVKALVTPKENPALIARQNAATLNDIRDMDLSLDDFSAYRPAEQRYIQRRLNEYANDFTIEKATDRFQVLRAVLRELSILQLERLKIEPQSETQAKETQAKIDALDKEYRLICDSLNVLKKNRETGRQKPQNQGTDLTEIINRLDKPVEDMEFEVEKEQQEEQKMIRKLAKQGSKESAE